MVRVTLRPFTEDLLPVVRTWFEHPEVQRWLGGPDWPGREFHSDPGIGEIYRGRRVLRTHSWVAFDSDGEAVGQIGGDVYDRWTTEAGPAMGFAYVVDPRRWGRGYGTATLLAMMDAPEMGDVQFFAAGIEPENVASVRCAMAAGMTPETTVPDDEGIVYYLRRAGGGVRP